MKKFICLLVISSVFFSSCKKEKSPVVPIVNTGGNNTTEHFFINFSNSSSNYVCSTESDLWESIVGSNNQACYFWNGSMYKENADFDEIEPAIHFRNICLASEVNDSFFDVFNASSFEYAFGENTGVGMSVYAHLTGLTYSSWNIDQPASSSFTVTSVTENSDSPGSPYVILKGNFNCTLANDEGAIWPVTNGTFRVVIEKM